MSESPPTRLTRPLLRYEVVQKSDGPAGSDEDVQKRCFTRWGADAEKKRLENSGMLQLAWQLGAIACGMRFSIVVRDRKAASVVGANNVVPRERWGMMTPEDEAAVRAEAKRLRKLKSHE